MKDKSFLIGAVVGLGATLFMNYMMGYSPFVNPIPKTDKVQTGFVVPSKLEIELQDLDGNGQKEVIMRYNGRDYLLTLDEQGNPRVQIYEVKPAELVPKK